MELYDEIGRLIDLHQEGSYWDLKKEWYGKDKDSDQLIDIICMANNLANRDAYITQTSHLNKCLCTLKIQ